MSLLSQVYPLMSVTQVEMRPNCVLRSAIAAEGWGTFDDDFLLPFERKKDELSIHDGCVLHGSNIDILVFQG